MPDNNCAGFSREKDVAEDLLLVSEEREMWLKICAGSDLVFYTQSTIMVIPGREDLYNMC